MMTKCVHDVSIELAQSHAMYTVVHPEIGYYYQDRDIKFTQTDKYLYITVKIPVAASSDNPNVPLTVRALESIFR